MTPLRETAVRTAKKIMHKSKFLETAAFLAWGYWTLHRARKIFKTIKHKAPEKNYTVLIHSVRTLPIPGLIYFEAMFAHAFRKNGVHVKMLFHDNILDSTDSKTITRTEDPQKWCSLILGNQLKKSLAIETLSYRDYITPSGIDSIKKTVNQLKPDELDSYHYLGVNVGLQAKASAIRYFLTGFIDLKKNLHLAVFQQKLINAMITTYVAKQALDKEKPDLLFTLHGVYSTWGPFFEYFRNHNRDTIIYGLMTIFGSFIFLRNTHLSKLHAPKEWELFSQKELTPQQKSEVKNFLQTKIMGTSLDQKLYQKNYDKKQKKRRILETLSSKHYTRQYIMYPNLTWDVAVVETPNYHLFPDIFSWVDTVMHFFQKNQHYQLIIKPHPAELVWEQGTIGIREYILRKYNELPQNIFILPASTPLNAYELAKKDTIGLLFNGSLGLELPCFSIPVLVGSSSIHYRQAGITYPIETKEEYIRLMENPRPVIEFAQKNKERAKKYCYFLFFKSSIEIPIYRNDEWSTQDWNMMEKTDYLMSKESPIIKITNKIISGEEVIKPL